MLKLMRISEALGIETVAFVGDRQQLSSIDWGKSFAMVQAGGITMERMEQNVRINPENKQLLTVAALANNGRVAPRSRFLARTSPSIPSPHRKRPRPGWHCLQRTGQPPRSSPRAAKPAPRSTPRSRKGFCARGR
ncbi:AAA family ATPase [Novosphingobium resinovorum]